MPENQTIYLVTAGCYSDWHIDSIFATQELAEERRQMLIRRGDDLEDAEVEAWPLLTAPPKYVVYWEAWQEVPPPLDHKITRLKVEERSACTASRGDLDLLPSSTEPAAIETEWGDHTRTVVVRARSRETAIKALQDRVAQIRAEREGIA